MERPRARPRFTFEHPLPPDAVVERVRAHLAKPGALVTGSVFRRTVMLTVTPGQRHFWSPYLDLQFDAAGDRGSRIDGTFAPHPNLWTLFVGIQLLFGFLSVAAAIFLTSRLMLGQSAGLAVLLLGVMLFGGGFSYGAAYVGQGFGSEQMYELRAFLDAALREE